MDGSIVFSRTRSRLVNTVTLLVGAHELGLTYFLNVLVIHYKFFTGLDISILNFIEYVIQSENRKRHCYLHSKTVTDEYYTTFDKLTF